LAGHRPTAHEPALLIGEVHDLECMAQSDVLIAQVLRNLDGAHHADVTIVVASMRHRVGVRAHDDNR
jgi:hypothetical protein